jgi:hypothetical protein
MIALAAGSSVDQQSNNVTLFNLVEQVSIPPGVDPPPGSKVPLEMHAYLRLDGSELGREFEMRFALVGPAGLETFTDPKTHRAAAARIRTRALGVPFPALLGHYELRVDFRVPGEEEWSRDASSWPIAFLKISAL